MAEDPSGSPPRRPSISQLSKTPSWVMLGFILGAVFILALPRREQVARPIVLSRQVEKRVKVERPELTTVEAVFDEWSRYAVWDDDSTQIAMWNPGMGEFSDFYEVRRINGQDYFRSIPHLTNRILRHGRLPPPECPLRFTETDAQYREWRTEGRVERLPDADLPVLRAPDAAPAAPTPTTSTSIVPFTPPAPPPMEKPAGVLPK